jgi:hypothetical protein
MPPVILTVDVIVAVPSPETETALSRYGSPFITTVLEVQLLNSVRDVNAKSPDGVGVLGDIGVIVIDPPDGH